MKVVREPNFEGDKPLAGCVCSSGRNSTRGPWDPIWNCNCSCDHGDENYNYNFTKADVK